MGTNSINAIVKRNRFKMVCREFVFTLMGGRKQRWDTIRRLAMNKPQAKKKG